MRTPDFGWSLPPGVTDRMIDEAFGEIPAGTRMDFADQTTRDEIGARFDREEWDHGAIVDVFVEMFGLRPDFAVTEGSLAGIRAAIREAWIENEVQAEINEEGA